MIELRLKCLPALLLFVTMILTACSEPDEIGIDVQPAGDQPGVFYTDTITIEASTIREDTLRSDEASAAFNLAGSYTDPVFGFTNASFYSQIRLPNNNTNFTFGILPQLDSVVLTLTYADNYGDTITPLSMEVFQLDAAMTIDSTYYTNDQIAYIPTSIFSGVIDAHTKDSVEVDGVKKAPHLRLKLNQQFGDDFISSPTSNFIDNATFISYFKGIHVKVADVTTTGQGRILSFNLLSSQTKMTFYYKNGTDSTRQIANFEINAECPRFNRYTHDYTIATFGNNFPIPGNSTLYVQSMAGVKARIKFPYLKDLTADGPLSINKAELVIPVEDNETYENHDALIVFGVDSLGGEAIIPDLLESVGYYGGSFNSTGQDYKFNIARYVQRLVSGNISTDYGLSIVAASGGYNAQRSVIPGPGGTSKKMQLKLTYSKLK